MDTTILLFLLQDGITSGAVYALLGLGLVLVFAVTRVILIPQGEFVTYGALTYATLSTGNVPGTAYLVAMMGLVALCFDLIAARRRLNAGVIARALAVNVAPPLVILGLAMLATRGPANNLVNFGLSLVIVAPIGAYLYRIAFQPIAHAWCWCC